MRDGGFCSPNVRPRGRAESGPTNVATSDRVRALVTRSRVDHGRPWLAYIGWSRAVRVGNYVTVSGTSATQPDGSIAGIGDPYAQASAALLLIEQTLRHVGARMADVVRTRMYLTNMDHWEAIGRAHGEAFAEIMPAATMVEVTRLIHPDLLVEIEVDAIVDDV